MTINNYWSLIMLGINLIEYYKMVYKTCLFENFGFSLTVYHGNVPRELQPYFESVNFSN